MRGKVKNKNARHNNVISDFEQLPCLEKGRGTVVSFDKYAAIRHMRNMAAMWMQQDSPLVAEQNRYFDVRSCGIGWHGCARQLILKAIACVFT